MNIEQLELPSSFQRRFPNAKKIKEYYCCKEVFCIFIFPLIFKNIAVEKKYIFQLINFTR